MKRTLHVLRCVAALMNKCASYSLIMHVIVIFASILYISYSSSLSSSVQPIPYWLYKLHGLNITYTCEICGNATYRGPKAFQRHFSVSTYSILLWIDISGLHVDWDHFVLSKEVCFIQVSL